MILSLVIRFVRNFRRNDKTLTVFHLYDFSSCLEKLRGCTLSGSPASKLIEGKILSVQGLRGLSNEGASYLPLFVQSYFEYVVISIQESRRNEPKQGSFFGKVGGEFDFQLYSGSCISRIGITGDVISEFLAEVRIRVEFTKSNLPMKQVVP